MQVGDKIMYHTALAELKFIGTTGMRRVLTRCKRAAVTNLSCCIEFAPGVWLGVEFVDEGHGKHEGTVQGVSYFRAHHGRGLFIKPDKATWHDIPCIELV